MNDLIEVQIKKVIPTPLEFALFLGNNEKTFIVAVSPDVGAAIMMFIDGTKKPRPLTHDLIGDIFLGLGITVQYVVITDLSNNIFYARLVLKEENELRKKIVEVDARPSDCIALALQQKAKIYVTHDVLHKVEHVEM
ncbi:MAG: bifunctional nuclease family protein [Candidatus Ancaeobacter aquaticus]|nr:bifunctional nuclease family protein [Candidatus Ancaeobacter aquaticus]